MEYYAIIEICHTNKIPVTEITYQNPKIYKVKVRYTTLNLEELREKYIELFSLISNKLIIVKNNEIIPLHEVGVVITENNYNIFINTISKYFENIKIIHIIYLLILIGVYVICYYYNY